MPRLHEIDLFRYSKKKNVIEKLYLLVITLNINDDDKEEKFCDILTKFTRILTDLFSIIIDGKSSTNIPLNKTYYLGKIVTLTFLYGPMYLTLDDYPPYSDENPTFLRQTLTNNSDVFMDLKIMMNIIY